MYPVKKALSASLVHELWLVHAGDDSRLPWSEMEQAKPMAITSQQICSPESVSKCFQYDAIFFSLGICGDLFVKMSAVWLYFS